jgi:two-component system, chemotaxis family, sensor kinase CheA
MSSELDALWNEFAAETEEHLDAIERLLSDQRMGDWSRDDIAALFRYFHSLKGTFLAMGFANVEAVAHRCEDILSIVREGAAVLDRPLAQVLLRAVDRIKGMREDVIASREDAAPAVDLLRELENHCSESSVQGLPPPAPPDAPLSDDAEMLAIYSELLDQRLPAIALALSSRDEDRTAAADTAGELAYGAEMMGFEALAAQLLAIVEAATGTELEARADLIARLSELREQVKIIEEVTAVPSGAAPLTAALGAQLGPDYATALDKLGESLAQLDDGVVAPAHVAAAAESLRAVAACLGLDQSSRLLLFIEEGCRNLDPLQAGQAASVRDIARDTIDALHAYADAELDVDADSADALAGQWEASFQVPDSAGFAESIADQRLRPEVLAALSAEQRSRLENALAEGRRAFEILFELEANPHIAGDLIAWLSSSVETITSRTVYRDGVNCFEFLIFSEHPLDWIRAQLGALDPELACLHGIVELGRAPDALAQPDAMAAAAPAPIRAPLIRVRSETIDELMAEVGEMRTALAHLADVLQHGRIASAVHDARRVGNRLERQAPELRQHLEAMEADLRDLRTLENALEAAHRRIWTTGLQLRVVPVDGLFGRLSRAARDLAQKLGKDIDVVVEGREVRIDKSMVDVLIDPLMHMVRNAIDHGVESREQRLAQGKPARARLSISAAERGNRVDIIIADDGHGLDRSKILAKALNLGLIASHQAEQLSEREINALIFQPGFSTADAITEISGRGVGLDVVAATLQRLGGTIDMETWPGAGTRFSLKLPVSAALLRALLVDVDGQIFALPERQVVSVLELAVTDIEDVAGQEIVLHRGVAVPLRRLAVVLGIEARETRRAAGQAAIISAGGQMLGICVDRVLRFQDLFLKELHPMLAASPVIAGASILGDGRPVLVLEARGLVGFALGDEHDVAQTVAPA